MYSKTHISFKTKISKKNSSVFAKYRSEDLTRVRSTWYPLLYGNSLHVDLRVSNCYSSYKWSKSTTQIKDTGSIHTKIFFVRIDKIPLNFQRILVPLFPTNNIYDLNQHLFRCQFLDSIVVSIAACHAEYRGSIPHRGGTLFFFVEYFELSRMFRSFFDALFVSKGRKSIMAF